MKIPYRIAFLSLFSTASAVAEQPSIEETEKQFGFYVAAHLEKHKKLDYEIVDPDGDGISNSDKRNFVARMELTELNPDLKTLVDRDARDKIALMHADIKDVDFDKNNDVSADELSDFLEQENAIAFDEDTMELGEVLDNYIDLKPKEPKLDIFGLRIRKTYSLDSLIVERDNPKAAAAAFKAASPATFSYTNNLEGNNDVWSAIGTVARPFEIYQNSGDESPFSFGNWELARAHFLPAVSFNRVTGTFSPKKLSESDTLSFRAGLASGLSPKMGDEPKVGVFQYQSIITALRYDTDFGGKRSVWAGEIDWAPIRLQDPISLGGGYQDLIPGFLEYRASATLHFEFGDVSDPGKTKLPKGSFARIGPLAEVTLFPDPDLSSFLSERLQFFARYSYLNGLNGEPGNADLFETGARFYINPEKQFTIEAGYTTGETLTDFVDVDYFHIALGLKF